MRRVLVAVFALCVAAVGWAWWELAGVFRAVREART